MPFKNFLAKLIRPTLLIVGTILVADAAVLIALDKINIGTILPLFIGSVFIAHATAWHTIKPYLRVNQRLNKLWQLGWGMFLVWLVSFVIFTIKLQQSMYQVQSVPAVKAILVLGSGSKKGQPTSTLAKRLDAAAPIAQAQPNAKIILSGGIDTGETISEAQTMANYLHERYGIPFSQMLLEDKSTSTELNFKNSQALLAQHYIPLSAPIAVVTSDFHTLRSAAIAKKNGYQQITVVGSPTPLSTRYNAWLREYFAFISGWVLREY